MSVTDCHLLQIFVNMTLCDSHLHKLFHFFLKYFMFLTVTDRHPLFQEILAIFQLQSVDKSCGFSTSFFISCFLQGRVEI